MPITRFGVFVRFGAARHVSSVLALAGLLLCPVAGSAQTGSRGVQISPVPTEPTNEPNPEIHVSASDRVAYRYSLNGAPYSPELPVSKPIHFSGDLVLGNQSFVAGSSALSEFLRPRSLDSGITEFADHITFSNVTSHLQVTYLLNRLRSAIQPDNVLTLQGDNVADLRVDLVEKVPAGTRFELSALSIAGARLVQRPAADNARQFLASVPQAGAGLALTPYTNNGQTAVFVNGARVTPGQAVELGAVQEGDAIFVQTIGPDSSVASYRITVNVDPTMPSTEALSYYLRAFNPASSYISIHNGGVLTASYRLTFNQRLGLTTAEIAGEILTMEPEESGESAARKVWRFVRDNRYHFAPLTESRWSQSPALFFDSVGFGHDRESASLLQQLMTALGFAARLWNLNGHWVAEVFVDGRWEMWDPDLQVYYLNRRGVVASVEDLAADPALITDPVVRVPGEAAAAHDAAVAAIYASQADNAVTGLDSFTSTDEQARFDIPAGGTFEFPDVFERPLRVADGSTAPTYANARLIVPEGFAGTLRAPLVIQSIGWTNHPTLAVITRNAEGAWDARPTIVAWQVDVEPPFTTVTAPSGDINAADPIALTTSEPATIYYTTDGSVPSEASSVYSGPIVVAPGTTLMFFAIDALGNREPVRAYRAGSPAGAGGGPGCSVEHDRTSPCGLLMHASADGPAPAAPVLVNPGDQVNDVDFPTYRDTVRSDAPLAYWRLSDSGDVAADVMGAHPGTRVGSVASVQPGATSDGDAASQFNGTTAHIRVPNGPVLQLTADLTLELWLNVSLAARQTLLSKHSGGEFELTLESNGRLNFYQGDGLTAENFQSSPGSVVANAWQHVVVTRTASTKTIRFYVNGQPKGTATYALTPGASTRAVSIGRSETGVRYVTGRLDEVALYASALSPTRITTHYVMRLANGTGTPVELPLIATDANGDTLNYVATSLPPGLSVNPATGLISGTLTSQSTGVHQVVATASDGALSHSQSFLWTVTQHNLAPSLVNPGNQSTAEDVAVALQLSATDPDGNSLTYKATGLPSGLSINVTTGLISGVLPARSAGTYSVTVEAADATTSAAQSFTWTVVPVNHAPLLVNPGPQVNRVRSTYPRAVLDDGPVGYWRLAELSGTSARDMTANHPGTLVGGLGRGLAGALADGNAAMQFNGTNAYVSVPNGGPLQLNGNLTIELWLNLSLATRQTLISKDASREFELTLETNGQLNLYHGDGTTNENVRSASGAVAASGWHHVVVTRTIATKTVRFYVDGVLKGTGAFTLTPVAGTSPAVIGRAKSETRWVNGLLDEVALYPVDLTGTRVLVHYQLAAYAAQATSVALQLSATDPDGDTLQYGTRGLPPGLSADLTSGLVQGTLPAASVGVHQVTVGAFDGTVTDTENFTWTITAENGPPVLTSPGDQVSNEDRTVALELRATDPDKDPLTFEAIGLPPSLAIGATTGVIQGIVAPLTAGTYNVTVTVSDGELSTTVRFKWTIGLNRAPALQTPGPQTSRTRSTYPEMVRYHAPIALWRLDDTGPVATDFAGSHTGSLIGGIFTGQVAFADDDSSSMSFNGTNGYINVPNAADLQLAGDISIELWLNVSSLAARQTLISKGPAGEFELTLETNGQLNLYQGNGSTYSNARSVAGAVRPDAWQHVVVTRSAATKTTSFFVDGMPRGAGTYTVPATASTSSVVIGRAKSGSQHFRGFLDNVALYPSVLTEVQAADHYNAGMETVAFTEIGLHLSAVDPDGDILTYSATGLPPGLWIESGTGHIRGWLGPSAGGQFEVTVAVSDGFVSDSQTFTWTVTHVNRAPRISPMNHRVSAEGGSVWLLVPAMDPDNDGLTFSAEGLPPELSLDPVTGIIEGTLSFESLGTRLVTISVSDGAQLRATTFSWSITNTNRAPVFVSPATHTTHSSASSYAAAVRADSPLAYWRLGDLAGSTAADDLGLHHGTLAGPIVLGEPGALAGGDRAMSFNGTTTSISIPGSAAMPLADLSIEMWVKVSLASRQTLISKDPAREFELTLETNGQLNLYHGNGSAYINVRSSAGAVAPNAWQHIVVTRSVASQTIAFYVNGVAKGGGTSTMAAVAGTSPIVIGRSASGNRFVSGSLDDIAIYSTALSPEQVSSHYALRDKLHLGSVALQLAATDPDGDVVTYGASGMPDGLVLDIATGTISGSALAVSPGTYQFVVTATDGPLTSSQSFTWIVTE